MTLLITKRLQVRPHDTDNPHRRLMASILLQAYRDVYRREHHHDIATFLRSDWCAALCDGVDLSAQRYISHIRGEMSG